jgi:Fe-S-cluster containining protein
MSTWESLLGIAWPQNACDRSGECCRGAAQTSPWNNILAHAAQGDDTARDFLSQYMPYASLTEAQAAAPHAVEASLAIAEQRGDSLESVIFYRCRYLKGQSECQIYEDRPSLCRDFPESPFGAIPKCCGYTSVTQACLGKIETIRQELADLKKLQAMLELKPTDSNI